MFPAETTILVIDDMAGVRLFTKKILETLGFKSVMEAPNGEKAFETIKNQFGSASPVGLVLSDWNMPTMSGLDFLKKLRNFPEFKRVPVIFITAEGGAEKIVQAMSLGASDYILKPFTPDILKAKMEQIWNKITK